MSNKVLLLHGMTSSPAAFNELVSDFEEKNIKSFAPSLPGYRFNMPTAKELRLCNYEHETDEYLNYLSQLGKEKITIVGQSFGALLALRLALNFPDIVKKIIIISVPLDFREQSTRIALSLIGKMPYSLCEKAPGINKSKASSKHNGSTEQYEVTSLKVLSNLKNDILKKLKHLTTDTIVYQSVNDYHLNPYSARLVKLLATHSQVTVNLKDYGQLHSLVSIPEVREGIVKEVIS